MDIFSVLTILCVSVAGTAFMTWVPAYRKGVRAGKRATHVAVEKIVKFEYQAGYNEGDRDGYKRGATQAHLMRNIAEGKR